MIELTAPALRQIWPKAPQAVIDAFASTEGQRVLAAAGITTTRTRLSVALSEVEHETNGFTIKDLTENINYSAERAAQIWPSRFPRGAADVRRKYGTASGWQLAMFDDVYGSRMGNRKGTRDGSTFIGHGGPQWTGRDGHEALARILKTLLPGIPADMTAEAVIDYAVDHKRQPAVLAAFWIWKNLSPVCDAGGLKAVTKPWNGGYVGMADREARMAGNDPIVARLALVNKVADVAKDLPGAPPTPTPPKDVVDAATKKERSARKAGGGSVLAGGGNETVKTTTEHPTKQHSAPLPSSVAWGLIAVGVAIVVVATVLIVRKKRAVFANWI